MFISRLALCAVTLLFSSSVRADDKPFNLSLTPDVAVHSRTDTIKGLTLSIWGENPQSSVALGLVNGFTGDSSGFSWGYLVNYSDNYKGIQWAPVNYAGTLHGLQLGFINYAADTDCGVQIGVLNLISANNSGSPTFPTKWHREWCS